MKIGVYSDPHLTKKLPGLEDSFYTCIINAYKSMYDTFVNNNVELVVCCGDLFDKPVLEANSVKLFSEVMEISSKLPTKYLLGNHEILDESSNILQCVNSYHNQEAIVELTYDKDLVFIPYSTDLDAIDKSTIHNKIVFTHHDIYGSVLAGGFVKAGFGYDPNLFNDTKITFNGHIHLRSTLGKLHNIGSIFTTQYAELDNQDYSDVPKYYIYDTDTGILSSFDNYYNIFFITRTVNDYDLFDKSLVHVVRFVYNNEEEIKDVDITKALRVNYKKNISNKLNDTNITKMDHTLSMKDLVLKYIDNDTSVEDAFKAIIKEECKSLFEEVNK